MVYPLIVERIWKVHGASAVPNRFAERTDEVLHRHRDDRTEHGVLRQVHYTVPYQYHIEGHVGTAHT